MKPLLSATVKDIKQLDGRYPLMGSPKLDGIRALVYKGKLVSRNLKPIPNEYVQELFGGLLEGLDGELVVGSPTSETCFRDTSSGCMSIKGEPKVTFYVFDIWTMPEDPFVIRHSFLKHFLKEKKYKNVKLVPQVRIKDSFKLDEYEHTMTGRGYEGVMLKSMEGAYKHGRSTLKEGYLMKLKRFEDSEAEILSCVELMHNANDLEKDNLGHAKRSSKKAGLVKAGVMGAVMVKDIHTGVEFNIGAGFTDEDREWMWRSRNKASVKGRIIKYKYFPTGSKEKPRFPVYLGFRDEADMQKIIYKKMYFVLYFLTILEQYSINGYHQTKKLKS